MAVIGFFEKEKDKSDPFQEKTVFTCFMILLVLPSDYRFRNPSLSWARARREFLQLLMTG